MPNRSRNRSANLFSLLISVVIAITFTATIGIMLQLGSNPDELQMLRLVPWAVGGALVGFGVWFVLKGDSRQRSSRRRGGQVL